MMNKLLEKRHYTISQIAQMLNIEAHKVRYWEKKTGLIKPKRTKNNRRIFSKQDFEMVKRLNVLIHQEGHSIDEAARILNQDYEKYSKLMSMFTKIKTVLSEE